MHPTKNTMPEKTRRKVIDALTPLLIDTLDLQSQLKQAHWTIRGPGFKELHELFDEIAGDAAAWADLLAERIAQLGGHPKATARVVAKQSSLREYPLDTVASQDHVTAVSNVLGDFGGKARETIDTCDDLGDKDAADICTEISRAADKHLWFVESHASRFK